MERLTNTWWWSKNKCLSHHSLGARSAEVQWHQRTAICPSACLWQSETHGNESRSPGYSIAPLSPQTKSWAPWWASVALLWWVADCPRRYSVSERCWSSLRWPWACSWCLSCFFLYDVRRGNYVLIFWQTTHLSAFNGQMYISCISCGTIFQKNFIHHEGNQLSW